MNIRQKLSFVTSNIALLMTIGAAPTTAATFNFAYSSPSDTASGVLTTDPYNPSTNSYLITGISGTRDGVSIDSLVPTDEINSFAGNDNLLLADTSAPDSNGLAYTAGGGFFNVYFGGTSEHEVSLTTDQIVNFSATTVPEPSSELGMLGMGILTGGTLLKRKLKQKAKK